MTMHVRHLARGITALGLAAPLALTACNNDPESGGLTVTYSFSPGTSCDMDQEMVSEIRVEVGEGGTQGSQSIICDNVGGELQLAGVAAGSYDLFVLGIDPDGDAVLDNLGGNASDDRVEIIGGDSKTVPVILGLAPGRLEVALVVNNNGFPAQCSSDEITIKGIRAQAWDFANSEQLKSHDFDLCDFDGFEVVPDMDREINGRRFDGVVLQPLDGSNNPVGTQLQIPFADAIGAGKVAQIAVTCEADTCESQLLMGDPGTTTEDPTGGPTSGDPTTGDETDDDGTTGTSGGADSTGTG